MNILFYLVPKSSVVFVYDDYTIRETMKVLEKERFSSVPVLARDGRYLGSLSEGDILWGLKERGGMSEALMEQVKVRQLRRNRDNQAVNINCRMEELLQTSMTQNFIPVTDDNRTFIGIITRKSILQFFMEQTQKSSDIC